MSKPVVTHCLHLHRIVVPRPEGPEIYWTATITQGTRISKAVGPSLQGCLEALAKLYPFLNYELFLPQIHGRN